MKKLKALITGISGQDGSYLAELLLENGYDVYGIVRRSDLENPETTLWRLSGVLSRLKLFSGQLENYASLFSLLKEIKPDECYHLAAQSFVSYSMEEEFATMSTNVNGTHHLLSAIYHIAPECRFYFAGTSEMFGKVDSLPQDEESRFRPRSIYGISKLVGHELMRNYREQHGMFACTGILYNHESPRRGIEFVTRKITTTAVKIKLGLTHELRLGNIDAKRDWGYAKDYVMAMFKMLTHDSPDDYVVGSGQLHSVRDFVELVFANLDLKYENYLAIDDKLFRPSEEVSLVANNKKACEKLNWRPETSFEELVKMMVKADYDWIKGNV